MIRSCLAADECLDTARYICQLDEQWFDLTKDTLRDALQITPVNNNNPFSSPPTPDALINFINNLGYSKVVKTLSAVMTNDMFQPWRALTMIINLCLTGKTSGFERPRALVLQILRGIVNQAFIDYTERMWEEFTQSINSFIKDKKNLALHTQEKKKSNPIVILSVRFTKMIIHHLQSKHKFHLRPDSPLRLPYEEYILGYLKFSAKETKREVFGMPILNELITTDIQGEQYYKEYLEKVAKHQRYLVVIKPASSQQPKPKPAPAKSQEKKHKLVTETSDKPSPAKRYKQGLVTKLRKPTSSLRVMSSPNHPTTDVKDAFSSNFLDYTTASPNYFPASPGNISPDPPDNLSKYLFPSLAISPFHDMQAYNAVANKPTIPPQDPITSPTILTPSLQIHTPSSSSTTLSNSSRKQACILVPPSFSTTPPQIYELGKSSIKMRIKHHEEQIKSILNYLEELSFHRIEKMEEILVNG
nr:hypothetical protein [Tanacetum cinerariifolium]